MRIKCILLFLMIILFSVCSIIGSETLTGKVQLSTDSDRDSQSHPYHGLYQPIIDKYIEKGLIGLGVLIKTNEDGTWNGTGGLACIEDGTPVRPETVFASLSVVKTYTAAAVMYLRDEGRINLQSTIDTYLDPEICDRIANGYSATVLDLLRHSSGIPDFGRHIDMPEAWNNPFGWTWRDNLEKVYGHSARFVPGTQYEYTNINYLLLALIIDEITGSHADFFNEIIFQPMGLNSTYYKIEPGLPCPPGVINFYYDRYGDGYLENWTEEFCALNFNSDIGYSGILADMTDHACFFEGFVNGELVCETTFLEMAEPLPFPGNEWRGLGFSHWTYTDQQGLTYQLYATQGSSKMGYIELICLPGPGVTICTATNTGTENKPTTKEFMTGLMDELLDAVLNRQPAASLSKKTGPVKKRNRK